jgi:hypothetical protein
MKKIIYNKHIYRIFFACMAVALILMPACKQETGAPVITSVRNYAPSPNDTLLQTVSAGQWVVLNGENLSGMTQVLFSGIPATFNSTYSTNSSIVIQIPDIPFPSIPANELNEIIVVTGNGIASYEISVTGAPIISTIRNYADSPNDTIINAIFPGQQIQLFGYNLNNVQEILFQGVKADLTNAIYTDSSAVVQVPADLSGSEATLANTISYVTQYGSGTFSIKTWGPPVILWVSYETPSEGDSVYLYGNNFVSIQNLTFAGETISSFNELADGSRVGFIAPALTQSGPIVITTLAGEFTTAYDINDVQTGALSNFEWDGTFMWDWWAASLGVEDASLNEDWISVFPEFVGNGGKFLVVDAGILPSGDGHEWTSAVRITNTVDGVALGVPWFPSADNLTDPANNWALKFEINVPEDWNGASLCIKTTNGDYMVRYEPWKVSSTEDIPFTTKGWQTITIPLNSFRKNDASGDGMGAPIENIDELFNKGSINGVLFVYPHNYGTSDTKTGFRAAFDNFRVVKR